MLNLISISKIVTTVTLIYLSATPKLFSEEQNVYDPKETNDTIADETTDQLFDQDADEEEDFEIPAFLRRQKF